MIVSWRSCEQHVCGSRKRSLHKQLRKRRCEMIERTVERGEHGGIERILERHLSPLEETVILAWPQVKRKLLQAEVAGLESIEVEIAGVAPSIDGTMLADALADRFNAEYALFSGAKWRT